jgi:hypothetical protein
MELIERLLVRRRTRDLSRLADVRRQATHTSYNENVLSQIRMNRVKQITIEEVEYSYKVANLYGI